MLYVITQYYFGFVSAFSGQPLYEPVIYQFYNITMTSLPIMFYALFDFEYEKDYPEEKPGETVQRKPSSQYLMRNPFLYRIGMESALYGTKEFILWLLYAMVHAIIIYYVNFFALNHVHAYFGGSDQGKAIGFWIGGHIVYGSCIIVANLLILLRFNNFTGYGEFTVFLMILAYFVIFGIESLIPSLTQIYGIYVPAFTSSLVWWTVILSASFCVVTELFARNYKQLIGDLNQSDFVKDALSKGGNYQEFGNEA